MTCNLEQVGSLLSYNGNPTTFDALGQHAFKMSISKIPNTMFFLQGVIFPGISVPYAQQDTPHLDFQEIGTKVNYDPLVIDFLIDADLRNHSELVNWMQEMVVSTDMKNQMSDAILTLNETKQIRFVDLFPLKLDGFRLVSNQDSLKYLTCSATFNFDWFEYIPM